MDKNVSNSGFQTVSEGMGSVGNAQDEKLSATVPYGDVLIHSHVVLSWLDEKNFPNSFDASTPSPPNPDGNGGDEKSFTQFQTNIIVGKNGKASADAKADEFNPLKTNYTLHDKRNLGINIFDSQAKKVGTIYREEAKEIIKSLSNDKK